jgi:hypothetical protein
MTACAGHSGLPAEVRSIVLTALDRLEPVLERMQAQQAHAADASPPASPACAVCPICAVIAAWRGERSELAARTVEHATGLLAVLRVALEEGSGAPGAAAQPCAGDAGHADADAAAGSGNHCGRPVQRIRVHR